MPPVRKGVAAVTVQPLDVALLVAIAAYAALFAWIEWHRP
jgi:hypothetical protein